MERRGFQLEIRAARDNPRRLEGHAALFGVEARVGSFVESIHPGAFATSLTNGRDILALVDHDTSRLLGRTKSGTLRLSEDERGLAFSIDLPDTQAARDVIALAERNDLGGASIGFRVPNGGETRSGNRRELTGIHLFEVSVVSSWPAYQGTSAELRCYRRGEAPDSGLRRALERWRA